MLVLVILNSWSPLIAGAAGNAPGAFDIGTPILTELWVSVNGNDTNSGLASDAPLKTLTAAFDKIPTTLTTTGYRINLLAGTYPCEPDEADNCQNNFGNNILHDLQEVGLNAGVGFQNLPATITTDQNLSIRGNLIW